MNKFWSLSKNEKLKALNRAARNALSLYDLDTSRFRFYAWETNALYRIDGTDGCFIMRLASPGWRSHENLKSEALWLTALENAPDIHAPRVVPTACGELTSVVRLEEYDAEWVATVMSWQPGRLLGFYLTQDNLKNMGALFALLHIHGATWQRPADFSAHVFDAYLSRGESNYLEKSASIAALGKEDIALIHRTIRRVEDAYRSLDRSDIRVIHCDLWHDNIKLHKGELYPFDFEDTILGFRLHDIAMAMLDLLDDAGAERYPSLLNAFRMGYEELLDWPDGNMDELQAGRILWIVNYMARVDQGHLSDVMNRRRAQLKSLENTNCISL